MGNRSPLCSLPKSSLRPPLSERSTPGVEREVWKVRFESFTQVLTSLCTNDSRVHSWVRTLSVSVDVYPETEDGTFNCPVNPPPRFSDVTRPLPPSGLHTTRSVCVCTGYPVSTRWVVSRSHPRKGGPGGPFRPLAVLSPTSTQKSVTPDSMFVVNLLLRRQLQFSPLSEGHPFKSIRGFDGTHPDVIGRKTRMSLPS